MCGPEAPSKPRGGALAVLSAPTHHQFDSERQSWELIFHTPGSPNCTTATHAKLTGSGGRAIRSQDLVVIVHQTGDMRQSALESGLFRQVRFAGAASGERSVERLLETPVEVAVGGEGVIGRKVSVFVGGSSRDPLVIAEGVVGFNFPLGSPS